MNVKKEVLVYWFKWAFFRTLVILWAFFGTLRKMRNER